MGSDALVGGWRLNGALVRLQQLQAQRQGRQQLERRRGKRQPAAQTDAAPSKLCDAVADMRELRFGHY